MIFFKLLGQYRKPLVTCDSQSENIARYMLEKAEDGNHLQKYLEDNDFLKNKLDLKIWTMQLLNCKTSPDIWLRTILIVRKETRCRHIGYSYRLTAPSHRQDNTYHGIQRKRQH